MDGTQWMEFQHDKFNCGLHAVNNAVGHHFISEEELDIIADEIGRKCIKEKGFEKEALMAALKRGGYKMISLVNKVKVEEFGTQYSALLCWEDKHWFSLVYPNKESGLWELDSDCSKPHRFNNIPLLFILLG